MMLANIFSWDNPNLYFVLVLSVVNGIILCLASYKFLQIIQLSGYKNKPYFAWIKDTKAKNISKLAMLAFLSLACLMISNVLFNAFQTDKIAGYIGLIFYFYFSAVYIYHVNKTPHKTPLRLTKRMIRLEVFLFIVYTGLTFLFTALTMHFTDVLRLSSIPLLVILIPLIVPIANMIIKPLEVWISFSFINRANKKLKENKELIKVAITGSYGKTTTKNFLNDLLSTKYSVCKTPSSYNTPMGLTKVILKELKSSHSIFIAEFGAVEVGDIAYLTKMISPDYAVITSVGIQHLDTFKTFENIKNTKNEIITHSKSDAICVFNSSCETANELFIKCDKEKYNCCVNSIDATVSASNVVFSENGVEFDLCIAENVKRVSANILGKYNLDNLLVAITTAYRIGMSFNEIVEALPNIKPVAHRLELKKLDSGMLVIDDSFNANVLGVRQALEVLSLFKNRRKIVITPGLVELGEIENKENYEFGKEISKVADICIIVNKNQADNIRQGLLDGGFDQDHIIEKANLFLAKDDFGKILEPNDIILIANDLPDSYI